VAVGRHGELLAANPGYAALFAAPPDEQEDGR
jgi:hypothetical protein